METLFIGFVAILGTLATVLIIGLLSSILNGWVLTILWGWFIVPLFSLPPLSLPIAIGIALIIKMLTASNINPRSDKTNEEKFKAFGQLLLSLFLTPMIALLWGWIFHFFVK